MRALVLAFVLLGCLCAAQADMSQQFRDFIMQKHNQYRMMQGNGPYVYNMAWSDSLAQQAEEWVSNCRFEHPGNYYWGNMAYYNGNDDMENMGKAFQDWYQYYNYARNDCGSSCYNGMMNWYNAREVGCAYQRCPNMFYYGKNMQDAWFFACRYNYM